MKIDQAREPTGGARLLIDIGPLLVFFLVNFLAPVPAVAKIFVATGAFMVAMVVVMVGIPAEGIALILGLLTNLAAIGSVALSAVILLSQGGVGLGTGLGAPEFLTINVLVALLSVVILFSPAAKSLSLDSRLAERSPGLSPLLTNRRQN